MDIKSPETLSKVSTTSSFHNCHPEPAFRRSPRAAAHFWFKFGFNVIPIIAGTKRPAVSWDAWLAKLTSNAITTHWSWHPDHDVGFIVGGDHFVLDADGPQSTAALETIEARFGITPILVVRTKKGVHHYYKLAAGTFAKSDAHSTEKHPDRLDIKTGRALVVLPPSSGRSVVTTGPVLEIEHASNLSTVDQDFVDAVYLHNGRKPPRPPTPPSARSSSPGEGSLRLLQAIAKHLDPDVGYRDWFSIAAAIFNEAGGCEDAFELFDLWSSQGQKYKGVRDTRNLWQNLRLDHPNPITMATLRRMVEANGHDWLDVCAASEDGFDIINDCEVA